MTRRIFFFLFLLFILKTLRAQEESTSVIRLQPEIVLGYTFGEKFMFGVELNCLASELVINSFAIDVGGSVSWYWVMLENKDIHRIASLNGLLETEYAEVKLGFGQVKYKWGYGKRNRESTIGMTFDVSGTYPPDAPWIGFRTFFVRKSEWIWKKEPPYLMLYGYMRSSGISFNETD